MTDKQIINITIDDLINGNLRDMEFTAQFGVYRQAVKGLAEQLKAKEQEYEELKKQIKIIDDETIVVEITEKQFEEYQKLKQALTEIKEIADGMHDLWINKTPYTDIDNLVVHLLECELNRIRYKFDDISEVLDE